jgi:hypothetical protein
MSRAGTWTPRTTSPLSRPVGSATVRAHVETGRCPSARALRSGSCARRGWALVGAARRSLSSPYHYRPTSGRLRLPPLHAAQALTPPLPSCASNTQSPFPGCRVGTASSQARFAAHMPPPSNSFHSQLHSPPIAAPHLLLTSRSHTDEGNQKIFGRPYQARLRSSSPVTTSFRPSSSPTNGTNRTTLSTWCLCLRPLIVLALFPRTFP